MHCPHFDAHRCRSCTLVGVPYAEQLQRKDAAVRRLLSEHVPAAEVDVVGDAVGDAAENQGWEAPFSSAESGFRNKAKLVVTGTAGAPRLGILDPRQHPKHHDGTGVDLRDCGLYEPGMEPIFHAVADAITAARLTPYDVAARRGELKQVHVTLSPDREAMLRFVLRSRDQLPALRGVVAGLEARLAELGTPAGVVSANLLPEHVALPEGTEEIPLAGAPTLTMRVNGVGLRLRPQGFFQTNTAVTAGLYATAAAWAQPLAARTAWDLYCGVGGFAFHLAQPVSEGGAGVERVTGIETSAEAIAAALQTARERGLSDRLDFHAGDAREGVGAAHGGAGGGEAGDDGAAEEGAAGVADPELVVVNPPRRGIGTELAGWLEQSSVQHVLYSSCHAVTLARDLSSMPSLRVRRARVFDMFPQTEHAETLVLLSR